MPLTTATDAQQRNDATDVFPARRAYIKSFGCQMNVYDSQRMADVAGLPVSRRDRPLFAWYGDTTFMPHFRRFVALGPTRCDVHYGPPIPVSAETGRKILARRTEAQIRALAGAARTANCPILADAGSS